MKSIDIIRDKILFDDIDLTEELINISESITN